MADWIGKSIGGQRGIRIEAPLGRGGMGEVYQGFDTKLERLVALKTIRGSHRLDATARARFRREALALSKLDHPNICRIYDLVEEKDQDFLVLELVEGRPLSEIAATTLSWPRRLEIATGIADALAAAHNEGVVHRDLKASNVMLTDDGGVKVLDFGVARSLSVSPLSAPGPGGESKQVEGLGPESASPTSTSASETSQGREDASDQTAGLDGTAIALELTDQSHDGADLTRLGTMVGTLQAMSPEQARGEAVGRDVTTATDLYSFGILLQQLLTGRPAYADRDDKPLEGEALRTRVLEGRPDTPTSLDTPWRRLLGELTEVDPRGRPTATEVAKRLRWLAAEPLRQRRRRRLAVSLVTTTFLLLIAVFLSRRWAAPPPLPPLLEPGQTARIALLPFANETGDPTQDWFGLGLRDLVATNLGAVPSIQLIAARDVVQMVEGLGIEDLGAPEAEELDRLSRALGSDLVIATSVTGGGLARSNRTGSPATDAASAESPGAGESSTPSRNVDSRIQENEGDYRFRYTIFDAGGSVGVGTVTASEPTQGANQLAARIARRLDPEVVVSDLRETFTDDPYLNQTYAIGVTALETSGAQSAEPYFEVCLDRRLDFSRAALQMASALHTQGDWARSKALLEGVLEQAERRGDQRLLSEGRLVLASVLRDQGDLEAAKTAYQRVLEASRQDGSRSTEAAALRGLSLVAYFGNDLDLAEEVGQEALVVIRELGDRRGEMTVFSYLAAIAADRGDDEQANDYDRKTLAMARELGDRHSEADFLGNLGLSQMWLGKSEEARDLYGQSLALAQELNDRPTAANIIFNLGLLAQLDGQWPEANLRFEEARDVYVDLGDVRNLAAAAIALASVAIDSAASLENLQAWIEEADVWYDDNADLFQLQARLAWEQGDRDRAIELQRKSIEAGTPWDEKGEEWLAHYLRNQPPPSLT